MVQVYFNPIVESLKRRAKTKAEWKKPLIEKQKEIIFNSFQPQTKKKIDPETEGFERIVLQQDNMKPEPVKIKITSSGQKIIRKSDLIHKNVLITVVDHELKKNDNQPVNLLDDPKKVTIFNRQLKFTAKGIERVKPLAKPVFSPKPEKELKLPSPRNDVYEFANILKRVLKPEKVSTEQNDTFTPQKYYFPKSPISSHATSPPELTSFLQTSASRNIHVANAYSERIDEHTLKLLSHNIKPVTPRSPYSLHKHRASAGQYSGIHSQKEQSSPDYLIPKQFQGSRVNSLPKLSPIRFDPGQVVGMEHEYVENNELFSDRQALSRLSRSKHNLFRTTKKKLIF